MWKYYFIVFTKDGQFHNDIIKGDPLHWQQVANEKLEEKYVLVNWIEISEQHFDKWAYRF